MMTMVIRVFNMLWIYYALMCIALLCLWILITGLPNVNGV